jgi:hypothetical protein
MKCHITRGGMKAKQEVPVPMEVEKSDAKTNVLHVEVIKPASSSSDKEEVMRIEIEKPAKRCKAKENLQVAKTLEKTPSDSGSERPVRSRKSVDNCSTTASTEGEKPTKRSKAKENLQVAMTLEKTPSDSGSERPVRSRKSVDDSSTTASTEGEKPTKRSKAKENLQLAMTLEKTPSDSGSARPVRSKKSVDDSSTTASTEGEKPTKRSKAKENAQVPVTPQDLDTMMEKPARSKKSGGDYNTFVSDFNRKMHDCPMCPYFSKSKTDMLYHKQFHRKRALVKYKCQHCDYWAMQKRVISQHEKLHDPAWRINRLETLKQRLVKDHDKKTVPVVPPPPPSVQSSPAKSEVSERSYADYDPVDIASIKHDLILSKITAVPISTLPEEGEEGEVLAQILEDLPQKEAAVQPTPEEPMDEEDAFIDVETVDAAEAIAQVNADAATNVVKPRKKKQIPVKKLHRCRYCPYTNIRGTNLRLHEKMHGFRDDERLMKCPKCDYHVGNKGLLTHHLKVHADNYQPEFAEPDLVNEETGKLTRLIFSL